MEVKRKGRLEKPFFYHQCGKKEKQKNNDTDTRNLLALLKRTDAQTHTQKKKTKTSTTLAPLNNNRRKTMKDNKEKKGFSLLFPFFLNRIND